MFVLCITIIIIIIIIILNMIIIVTCSNNKSNVVETRYHILETGRRVDRLT